MKGFVKIITITKTPYIRYIDNYDTIVRFDSLIEMYRLITEESTDESNFKPPNEYYDYIVSLHKNAKLCDEKCIGDIMDTKTCGFAAQFQKGFLFRSSDGNYYIVHPDDFEKVERIVNCTLDPIYELIQELRYHPVIGIDANIARKRHKGVIGE